MYSLRPIEEFRSEVMVFDPNTLTSFEGMEFMFRAIKRIMCITGIKDPVICERKFNSFINEAELGETMETFFSK